jgi:hypothetical protein
MELKLWRWRYTNEFGKRIESSWRMTEESAAGYKDAEKIEGTLEIRRPLGSTSAFQRPPPPAFCVGEEGLAISLG